MRLSQFSLCFLTVAISSLLYAEDSGSELKELKNSDKTMKLSPIVVTATRTPKTIAEIAGTVQTIQGEDIAQQAGASRKVADVLAQLVPSLAPSSGTTSNYGQTMRGRNVLVMINGVSQTGSRDVARQLNSISPNMIDHIEVVSGATSIYGSGATGGIINIITKRADKSKPFSFQTKLGLTSADNFRRDSLAYQVGQTASFNNDKMDGFLGVDYTSRGSQFDGKGNRIPLSPWQGSTMDTNTLDVNGRLNFNLTDQQSLSFGTQYYNDEQDTEYGPDYSYLQKGTQPSYKAIKGWSLDKQPFTERYAFNTQYQNQDFLGQTLNIEAYYRNEKARFVPYGYSKDGVDVKQSQSNVDYTGIRSTVQSDLQVADRALRLTYGLDYDREKDHQWADYYTPSNNGLVYTPTGKKESAGPDTRIQNIGTFVQGDYAITDRLNIQAGVRYQYVQADTDSYFTARKPITLMAADSTDSDKLLFNLGAVYELTDIQQVYANFSQGYSYPDVQRVLRDGVAGYTLTTSGIAPITVNSYELGWRLNQDKGLNLALTGFYNTSDKVVQFNSDRSVNVVDTDQRIYGAEATVSYSFIENYKVGGTLGYTRGQYKDVANNWHELNAFAVSPTKGTLFAEWSNEQGYGVRAQIQAIKGTDKAYKDDQALKAAGLTDSNSAAEIKGYTTMDVLAHFPMAKGRVDFGLYNLWDRQYKTVFAQQAAVTNDNPILAIPAEGRTFGLSYTINY
ncbi:TonB-dependent receptor [Acinetobacter sp. UBA1297]|uniref:TonB-dependent receptor n=1 Tax=Acinetobacter sp. UBA1297 TaxID=1945925 RepID=UPI00257C83B2|nr:TonB-dependent receptor [Acinetobacter sp. UBA1297]